MTPKPMLDSAREGQKALQTDALAMRRNMRGVGHLPVDREAAETELTEQERALRDSRPRTRRWRQLDKIDAEVDRGNLRHANAIARLTSAEETVRAAPERDARTLADWIAAGEKGARPAPTVYERERERDAARLLVDAALVEIDRRRRSPRSSGTPTRASRCGSTLVTGATRLPSSRTCSRVRAERV